MLWEKVLRTAVSAWNGGFACDRLPDGSAQTSSYFWPAGVGRVREEAVKSEYREQDRQHDTLAGLLLVGKVRPWAQKGPWACPLVSVSCSQHELSKDKLKNLRILSMSTDHSQVS
ncbi:hypothetical protein MGYG_00588 [Nannizzia gypsea CBS 118893]|uniref:Uncharacterized protein n=1 Tax=Arthroderma gypseum (strain ATCC MYA-4604 / CBS 118893) TaxID=535722 RepID=E5R0I8_ARTGP|nr:hypothetical protein MGYG_00588 [Nannizzia gypsea CBS 118893]EFQ97547.1 hypothetical protein MGYG_00588 [Nannizzia gypsea CBS 118893]